MLRRVKNNRGFTVIELIATIVIIGIWSSIVIEKTDLLADVAEQSVTQSMISSLNSHELMVWGQQLVSGDYQTDYDVWEYKDIILGIGGEIQFESVSQMGATVRVQGTSCTLIRQPSSRSHAGRWDFKT